MLNIDPRDFRQVSLNNEIIQQKISQISVIEKQKLFELFELKKRIRENDLEFNQSREKLKRVSSEYQKANEEYWNRGAGWNVEHLKILKNKIKQEMLQLEKLLFEPDAELEIMKNKFESMLEDKPDFELYEFYKLNYETFVKEVNYYSVFTLMEDSVIKEFIFVPEWITELIGFGSITLLSDKTALGQSCHKREINEEFVFNDGDGDNRKFQLKHTRLISPAELDNLIHKLNVGLVTNPNQAGHNSLDLNNLGHLAAPVPFGGGGERRFNQLRTW